jgi:hydrogenase expression/formation protein HypC
MCLGIPGEVTSVSERDGLPFGEVRFGGVLREVCLVCYPDVVPGDFVLVHVGLAIAKIDRAEAARAWQVLEAIGQTADVAVTAADAAAADPQQPEEKPPRREVAG